MERRIDKLELRQEDAVNSLKSSNEHLRFVITLVTGIIAILVGIQGFTTYSQMRREQAGAEKVSGIMDVVKDTLDTRLTAEKAERARADKAEAEVEALSTKWKKIESHRSKRLDEERARIESLASSWAKQHSRHDFRRMASELAAFAHRHDAFKADAEEYEELKTYTFTARVPYIRGIAAHYGNLPAVATEYLEGVTARPDKESDEDESAFHRRKANAFYYRGVIASNFAEGEEQNEAIRHFHEASELDDDATDLLTRLVTAEAHAMMGGGEAKAFGLIEEVRNGAKRMAATGKRKAVHNRLVSRADLIGANLRIIGQQDDWASKAEGLLTEVHRNDPGYYYATATLAQVLHVQGKEREAKDLFSEASRAIERSGDRFVVTEVRSRVLLLMVAAMCAKHGQEHRAEDDAIADAYLNLADELRAQLPRIGDSLCTVFSPLRKVNADSEKIGSDIEHIREGKVLG
jgi:tetratricopeptide (TPR) repeat protein